MTAVVVVWSDMLCMTSFKTYPWQNVRQNNFLEMREKVKKKYQIVKALNLCSNEWDGTSVSLEKNDRLEERFR